MITEATFSSAEIADELRPVLLRLSRELRHETERLGVTPRQATLLWLIRGLPGSSLRDLAEQEQISAPALSGHVDRLERAGLVERVRSTTDRRRVGLRITPAGDRLLRRLRARRTTWLAERLERLEPAEAEAVAAALPALRRLLDENT
jgi:DNA-binding MarR family transcriptional regulator